MPCKDGVHGNSPTHTDMSHAHVNSNHLVGFGAQAGTWRGRQRPAGNWATLPLVFGIMAFVYSGHGVFPSVRASMRNPEQFPKARR